MVVKISIQNFKSIDKLEIELGRLNVFIGANGSGKSNLLEGIAMGAAGIADKLEHEFLSTRIRVTSPKFMTSAFESDTKSSMINISFAATHPQNEWIDTQVIVEYKKKTWVLKKLLENTAKATNIKNYLIFAPENHFLRNFNEESQIRPLGLRGEGLFNHIAELHEEKPELFAQINEQLRVLDWFDGFEMPNDLKFTEKRIRIKDNYLQPDLSYFDQRSANEGFLYLLFYFTLFVSDETPSFFAIDNIDNAMNPKLGRQLVKTLAKLAKQHQKQAILTTHNPAILDGLNLDDDEQRLFVIYRNADGQTRVRRIFKKNTPKNASLPLSEMFLRGYLGGLPNNF